MLYVVVALGRRFLLFRSTATSLSLSKQAPHSRTPCCRSRHTGLPRARLSGTKTYASPPTSQLAHPTSTSPRHRRSLPQAVEALAPLPQDTAAARPPAPVPLCARYVHRLRRERGGRRRWWNALAVGPTGAFSHSSFSFVPSSPILPRRWRLCRHAPLSSPCARGFTRCLLGHPPRPKRRDGKGASCHLWPTLSRSFCL